jgi:adenosylcobinamide-GDP ribazoletransferase
MKDSRIGTYGVVALVLVLAAKVAALASLAPMSVAWALIAGHVLGRWSSLPLIWQYEYVRDESSTGKPFAATVTSGRLAVGTILAFGVVALVLRGQAVPVLIGTLIVTALSGLFFRRQIGGITGDTLGAANQLVELSTYLALAADLPLM